MLRNLPLLLSVLCLIVLYAQAQTPLTLGVPVQDDTDTGVMKVWTLSDYLPRMQDDSVLRIVATPLSGDVDLYAQFNQAPTTANYRFSSTSGQGDMLVLTKSDVESGAPLYIGVNALVMSRVVINTFISNSDVTAVLNDGEPQVMETYSSQSTYFMFTLDTFSNFTITVTPFSGDPDLYASTITDRPSFSNNTWSQRRYGFDILDINTNDPAYVSPGTYYVAVYGFGTTRYSISLTKRESVSTLMEAVPLAEDLVVREMMYYRFILREEHTATFSLTTLTTRGDPDLFIKKDALPTTTSYDWYSRRFGDDIITIPNAQPGIYYIGVYGYTEVTFQLVASTEKGTELLVDGVPTNAALPYDGATYFKFYAGDSETGIMFSAVPRFGSVTLYASKTSSRPGPHKFDYRSRSTGGEAFIYIPAPVDIGYYYVAAIASTETNFTMKAQTNHTYNFLQDGELSFWNHVPQGSYRYFIYDLVGHRNVDLTVTVRPELNKDVDLYISTVSDRPTTTNYQWRSTRGGGDTIVIARDDPLKEGRTRFFVAVYGYQASFFSILAFTSNSNLHLVDNTPFVSRIATSGSYQYFSFYMNGAGALSIHLDVPLGGIDADFYVSRSHRKPTSLDYEWRSINFGSDFLRIDDAYTGYYHIGVTVFGDNATFVLTASTLFQFVYDGSPAIADTVDEGQFRVYRTNVYSHVERVVLASTLINGATKMYISTNSTVIPGPDNYVWKSEDWPGNMAVIHKSDPKFHTGQWTFTIYGTLESDFFVSVHSSIASLASGVPKLDAATGEHPSRFSHYVASPSWLTPEITDDIVLSVRVFSGTAEVYATQNRTTDGPTKQHHDFSGQGSGTILVRIPANRLKVGTLYINVFAGNKAYSRFLIAVSAMSEPKFLTQEQPIDLLIPSSTTQYFQLLAARSADSLFVSLDACSDVAPPPFLLSTENKKPNSTSYEIKSVGYNTFTQLVVSSTVKTSTTYFAAVSNPGVDAAFQIYATTKFDMRPTPGAAGEITYGRSAKDSSVFALTFTAATIKTADTHVVYKVYKRKIPAGVYIEGVNFQTECAIESTGKFEGQIRIPVHRAEPTITYEINVDSTDDYLFNVIAENGLGLSAPYKAVHVRPHARGGLGAGWVIIILALVGIILYLVGGAGYNYVKGNRGVEMIPNIRFWVGLPYLVIDGVKFVFTGEFLRKPYARMQDESGAGEQSAPASSEPVANSGGYGSIA